MVGIQNTGLINHLFKLLIGLKPVVITSSSTPANASSRRECFESIDAYFALEGFEKLPSNPRLCPRCLSPHPQFVSLRSIVIQSNVSLRFPHSGAPTPVGADCVIQGFAHAKSADAQLLPHVFRRQLQHVHAGHHVGTKRLHHLFLRRSHNLGPRELVKSL